jgi:hypothetical protein
MRRARRKDYLAVPRLDPNQAHGRDPSRPAPVAITSIRLLDYDTIARCAERPFATLAVGRV